MDENNSKINWFPGHMAKAIREIKEKMNMADLIIELRDARIPYSSANPKVDEICGNKPRLILLNKANIADKKITAEWINYFKEKNILALDIDALTNYNIKNIFKYANIALKDVFLKREAKHIKSKTIKAIIIGIPNCGKSTLINTLAKRKAVQTGDKPGVTKNETWIKINDDFFILDTPGILWPKFEDQEVAKRLAFCSSIKDEVLHIDEIAKYLVSYLKDNYRNLLKNRYNISDDDKTVEEIIEDIAKKRGCLLKAGEIDYLRCYNLIINDLRANRIGDVSYERPSELI